ncbi:dihydropteroate synthase [Roseovarius salinarum]|uniref:dihydropteroate synthase n=1 Tax=Roseovarius salinarum TaxID=1981892 RepID=UPI000C322DDF|nr:dihydropteroate synthase [Roseovarius salinarum]
MTDYFRPIPRIDPARPKGAHTLAGGWCWFAQAEVLRRGAAPEVIAADDLAPEVRETLTRPRAPIAGLGFAAPRLMGILNVTPDSFSDGGEHATFDRAVAHALSMTAAGADMIDVGGESTRPGATEIPASREIDRAVPVIAAVAKDLGAPISIDTRKTAVARAARDAGAALVNDVSAFTFDDGLAPFCAEERLPVCAMHAQGDPQTMQDNPSYDDVLLDVYDFLSGRVAALEAAGIPRDAILVDPGIGFGKTQSHNLALLARLSLFHGLGCPVLLGASRKRFIGDIGRAPTSPERVPGSVAVALAGVAQGVQMLRVHDVAATRSALALWQAATTGDSP